MMTCQVLVWLYFIMTVFCVPRLLWCLCHSITCISRNMFLSVCPKVLLEPHPEHRPSLHVYPTSFASTKLYCFVTEAMDCLKVSIYSSAVTQSWLHVNVNKFDVLLVTPPRYVTRLYVCRKNLWQVYQTDNSILWDRFALPNTTRDSDHCWLRIYEWISYRDCRMSYLGTLWASESTMLHWDVWNFFAVIETNHSGILVLDFRLRVTISDLVVVHIWFISAL